MTTGVWRGLTASTVALVFVLLAGATYQGVATALERHRHPHPGRLVPAGSHQLHIQCTGSGMPTVVLEAPATGMSASWGLVQPRIAARTRVCSYDRAGLGWSEWGETGFEPEAVADQLRTLLGNAGEQPPFVLVGEGFGAALARISAARFPSDTAALVLLDWPLSDEESGGPATQTALLSPWLARTGLLRLTRGFTAGNGVLPEPANGALRSFLMRPDHLTRAGRELARWSDTIDLANSAALPDDLLSVSIGVAGQERTAMITTRAGAEKAAEAILNVVDRLRSR